MLTAWTGTYTAFALYYVQSAPEMSDG